MFESHSDPKSAAILTTQCDNEGRHYVSNDGGASWTLIGTSDTWDTAHSYALVAVSENTKIRVNVLDHGVIGGFIATVSYDGTTYSTTNPLGSGYWKLVSASDGITSLVYNRSRSSVSTQAIAADAHWVWNGNIDNMLLFEFDFGAALNANG